MIKLKDVKNKVYYPVKDSAYWSLVNSFDNGIKSSDCQSIYQSIWHGVRKHTEDLLSVLCDNMKKHTWIQIRNKS